MKALEEYKEALGGYWGHGVRGETARKLAKRYADAAIAELEAEKNSAVSLSGYWEERCLKEKKRAEQAEAAVLSLNEQWEREVKKSRGDADEAWKRLKQAEAANERLIETNNSDITYRVRAERAEAALAESEQVRGLQAETIGRYTDALAERERMLRLMVGEYRRLENIDLIISDDDVLADLRARAEEGASYAPAYDQERQWQDRARSQEQDND